MSIPFHAMYATEVYLPVSSLARWARTCSRRLRGRPERRHRGGRLPSVSWRSCTPRRRVRLTQTARHDGNVRISELAILSMFAADCDDNTTLFEIGTFDGRTTLNLAINAPRRCRVITLDLPPDTDTRFGTDCGEQQYIDKPAPGQRLRAPSAESEGIESKVVQQLGDSASYDFQPYVGACSLVFIDGSHAHDYVRSDTASARRLIKPGGIIVWHDYGVWPGVTETLDAFEDQHRWGLRSIAGTSLAVWRAPADHSPQTAANL